jgi:hypothetical protein
MQKKYFISARWQRRRAVSCRLGSTGCQPVVVAACRRPPSALQEPPGNERSMSFSAGCRKEQAGQPVPRSSALLARGIARLWLRARDFEAENRFAFLHQIKTISRNRFQIAHICLEQIDLARLARQ